MALSRRIFTNLSEAISCGDVNKVRTLIDSHKISLLDSEGYELLLTAVKSRKLEIAELILSLDCRVNSNTANEDTPLHCSVVIGNIKLIRNLLNKGADIDACDKTSCTPLLIAVKTGHNSVAKLLLNRGASPDICDNNNLSPIHHAAKKNAELVSMLLKFGAAIDKKSNKNFTALHFAATAGNLEVVKLLINKGASKDALNDGNETALHIAVFGKHKNVSFLVGAGASVINHQNLSGESLLHLSVKQGKHFLTTMLLEAKVNVNMASKRGATPLYTATMKRNLMMCKLLLEFGANVDIADERGKTPLYIAVKKGFYEIVELLLKYNADVYKAGNCSFDPVFLAVLKSNDRIFSLLIKYGAELKIYPLSVRITALKLCIQKEAPIILEYILKHTKIAVLKRSFDQLLKQAVMSKNAKNNGIVKLLFSYGFSFSRKTILDTDVVVTVVKHGFSEILKGSLKHCLKVNKLYSTKINELDACRLIHIAVYYKNVEMVRMLLSYRASVNFDDRKGRFPLYVAIDNCDKNTNEDLELINLLLKSHSDINCFNQKGFTALHKAVSKNNEHVTEMLLKRNANVNCVSNSGLTPLHLATSSNVAELLLNWAARIDEKDDRGLTPLLKAVLKKNYELVKLCVKYDADIHLKDNSGLNALEHAAKGDTNIFKHILKNGADINYCDEDLFDYIDWHYSTRNFEKEKALEELIAKFKVANFYLKEKYVIKELEYEMCVYHGYDDICKMSLSQMKSEEIDDSPFTFYDTLASSTTKLATYMRREDFLTNVQENIWWLDWPCCYQDVTQWKFYKALRRKKLLDEFEPVFYEIFPFAPEICVANITKYLTNDDLRVLVCLAKIQRQDKITSLHSDLNFMDVDF